ncbi:hypothetical protein N752_23710 [Desulforamulus aquiferis]|nr:hypothetical protein N752_23710 [Desulforamulus aquiferis]
MAHAIIGGLITSTMLTLVVVPVIYSILDDLKVKGQRLKELPKAVSSRFSRSS